jgi:hypothetical protein
MAIDRDKLTEFRRIQGKHKVRYRGYWVEVGGGKVLCLVEAPSAAAPEAVHCEGGPSL